MNLTRTTAHAFAKDRIRINAITPAIVGTERIRKPPAHNKGLRLRPWLLELNKPLERAGGLLQW
jgi:NAD(P)-dependent dehydrogenase (short-subunit alcohol dehydrogenase family)